MLNSDRRTSSHYGWFIIYASGSYSFSLPSVLVKTRHQLEVGHVVLIYAIDNEIFWLCQVTRINKTVLHGIRLNMLEEGKYVRGDRCKIKWNNIVRPEKSLEKIFVLPEFSGSVYDLNVSLSQKLKGEVNSL